MDYSDDDYSSETVASEDSPLPRRRRSPRGPIRSIRLTQAAQYQVDRQRAAQTRQSVAHQDPTLLASNATYSAWASLGKVSSSTLRALKQRVGEQTKMTQVQALSFPLARQGWSLRVRSKTGSGKMLAFLVPLMERVLETPAIMGGGIRLVIIAPTRELAQQIGSTTQELLTFHSTTTSSSTPSLQVMYGGTSIMRQVRTMERHYPSILVSTPGCLVELLDQKIRGRMFKQTLKQPATTSNSMMVVLDEADHLLSGFGKEISIIFKSLPRKRQTLLFSATLKTTTQKQGGLLLPQAIMADPIVGIQDIDCVTMAPSTGEANNILSDKKWETTLTKKTGLL